MNTKLQEATVEFIMRKRRIWHPGGEWSGPRWYPADGERCECCANIREPSRARPYSILVHCRTATHIARLHDVSESELKRAARWTEAAVPRSGKGYNEEVITELVRAYALNLAAASAKPSAIVGKPRF